MVDAFDSLQWRCPECEADLGLAEEGDEASCGSCGAVYLRRCGVWEMLPSRRESYYAQFLHDYETIREAEGRFGDARFYRTLPFLDRTHKFRRSWTIRARSFECLCDRVILPMEQAGALKILDLGAGNGWLSNRLASRGHFLTAVDISVSGGDGLGCVQHYETSVLPVRAEFDQLPWKEAQFDLAVFNASLHYSCDYNASLKEALRVIRPGGVLAIMDTPIYREPDSGRQMVREREREFAARFGFPSDALPMENFLTFDRLDQLGTSLGIVWKSLRPHYGWRWALRPWRARLAGRREPARFLLLVARKEAAG